MLRNEQGLEPRTRFDGPILSFDFPGLKIGAAEYDEGPTGCTVLSLPKRAALSVDVRGGSPGVFGDQIGLADAICLVGGSIYGLEAVWGVKAEILESRGNSVGWEDIALVSGAVIYDYGPRGNSIHPDKALGRAAFRNAVPGAFPLGARGAGRSGTVGKILGSTRFLREPGGQGAGFKAAGQARFFFCTVLNSLGGIHNRDGAIIRGFKDQRTGERLPFRRIVSEFPEEVRPIPTPAMTPNTTISALVTNLRLEARVLRQLGRQVHASMARAIQPFHVLNDGDVLFTASTGEVENEDLSDMAAGEICAELAWDAVLSAVS
jgi:L-aminopeptidase/D-esterase-like protein